MKVLVLIWALLAPACAHALDIKGIALGATKESVAQRYGDRWDCFAVHELQKCRKSVDLREYTTSKNETYAQQLVEIHYWFKNDALVRIEVKGLSSAGFDVYLAGLRSKFGNPASLVTHNVQNGLGNTFENNVATWKEGDGMLSLSRFGDDLETSSLDLTEKSYLDSKAGAEIRSTASDM